MDESLDNTTKVNKLLGIKNKLFGSLKQKTFSIFCINILIVIILTFLGFVQFETIDDYMIYELLSGKWGQATEFTVYINIFLSKLLFTLFNIVPSINWYVLMLLATHILSFTMLGHLTCKKYKDSMKIYLVILITMYIPFLIFLQYTSQAAVLILVGCIYANSVISNKEKKSKLVIAFLMIVFGSLIRFGALMYVLPYLALEFVTRLVKKEYTKSSVTLTLVFYVLTLMSCLLLKYVHNGIYNSNDIYKEYLEYSDARTPIHDYLGDSYTGNRQVYEAVGWSENDYISMMIFNNADDIVFNIDNLKYIVENVKITPPKLTDIVDGIFNMYFIPYLLILLLLVYMALKEGKKECITFAVLAIIIEIAFISMGKINIRTCMLNYVVAIIVIACRLEKICFTELIGIESFITTVAILMILGINVVTVISNKGKILEGSYYKLAEFVSNNQQNAYVYSRIWIKR